MEFKKKFHKQAYRYYHRPTRRMAHSSCFREIHPNQREFHLHYEILSFFAFSNFDLYPVKMTSLLIRHEMDFDVSAVNWRESEYLDGLGFFDLWGNQNALRNKFQSIVYNKGGGAQLRGCSLLQLGRCLITQKAIIKLTKKGVRWKPLAPPGAAIHRQFIRVRV